jgi:hypothetical protein
VWAVGIFAIEAAILVPALLLWRDSENVWLRESDTFATLLVSTLLGLMRRRWWFLVPCLSALAVAVVAAIVQGIEEQSSSSFAAGTMFVSGGIIVVSFSTGLGLRWVTDRPKQRTG